MRDLGRQKSPDIRQIDMDVLRTFRDHIMFRDRYGIKSVGERREGEWGGRDGGVGRGGGSVEGGDGGVWREGGGGGDVCHVEFVALLLASAELFTVCMCVRVLCVVVSVSFSIPNRQQALFHVLVAYSMYNPVSSHKQHFYHFYCAPLK